MFFIKEKNEREKKRKISAKKYIMKFTLVFQVNSPIRLLRFALTVQYIYIYIFNMYQVLERNLTFEKSIKN